MPEHLTPGVYVEEPPSGPRPIEGVPTAIAGFVGETERGPARPTLLTSWDEYARWFGGYVDRPPGGHANPHLPYAVRGFFDNGGRRLFVARVVGAPSAAAALRLPGDPGPTTLHANGRGDWGNRVLVAVQAATAAAQGFRIQVLYYTDGVPSPFAGPGAADASEDFDELSDDPASPRFAPKVVNSASRLVTMGECLGRPAPVAFPEAVLAGGTYAPATRADFLGDDADDAGEREGLACLCAIPEVSLLAIPDEVVTPGLASDLQDRCDALKDRFAILSGQVPDDPAEVRPLRNTSYGAIYWPWLRADAPHTAPGTRLVPPAGHVAGVYARVDAERGVHHAPANEVVQGALGLSQTLDEAGARALNARGVNVLRDLRAAGRGLRVWGGRTMSTDPEWKYVSVRRLVLFLERSIDRGARWVVFEPNSERTWTAVRASITAFLRTVWRGGALAGATEDAAFFVRCDRTTMTQDDIDNGRLVCLVGVAPARPAEFVILRIGQWTREAGRP